MLYVYRFTLRGDTLLRTTGFVWAADIVAATAKAEKVNRQHNANSSSKTYVEEVMHAGLLYDPQ